PPQILRHRPRASTGDPQLRPFLQSPAAPLFSGIRPADHVRTAMRLTVRCPLIRRKSQLHRYAAHMAERACHMASCALQFGLTWVLGRYDPLLDPWCLSGDLGVRPMATWLLRRRDLIPGTMGVRCPQLVLVRLDPRRLMAFTQLSPRTR